jgi:hypothetical protein
MPTLSDLDLSSARRISHYRYVRNDAPIPDGWTDDGPCPGHHGNWSRMATLAAAQQETLAMNNGHAETSTGFAVGNEFPNATGHIDPMATFAETPRMLPSFSTRAGRLRMIYVDAAGKQKALDINTADLTRILHSGAMALEAMTRDDIK